MEVQPREIQRYIASDGRMPYDEWFNSLRDINAQAKIISRLNRMADGNLGDYRSVGEGVCELKINYGPGYRIYFGQIGSTTVTVCEPEESIKTTEIQSELSVSQSS
ncbi:type II toxin-antitoxin system RelE/ParE family toxin [Kamptonema sp. UHCC 0994]|uniref:type II toxin-antitoxin system RelE/ParE family toxin n=1 Tax=Kamptonema sp. UHCC 0994 TaxID=3031329 RepID=UPI0023B99BB7|nr:type II toxin-antitoxin system RelE/ParE family toxin [Kamptonema sp. UHCC 0994]MDF0552342.1 type II toxin-antitoxin system RelE/ParE family toxin [Kamptonema sp. UHCC 0994]